MKMMKEVLKPYKVIDLKDYVDEKLFTYDWGDFWFDTDRIKSMSELKNHSFPDTKFPKGFTDEDKLECINQAHRDAEEQSYMSDYISTFHSRLLRNLNDNEDFENKVTFEYEESHWDSIKLKVFFGVEFLTGEVTDDDGEPYEIEQWLENGAIDWKGIIESTKRYMENYQAYDSKEYDLVYKDRMKDAISEIKGEKVSTYQKVKKELDKHLSTSQKVYNIIKIVQNGR